MDMSPATPFRHVEKYSLGGALALAALFPLIDALGRPLGGFHIPGSAVYTQQLTLWLAFLGGLTATREGKHLTLFTSDLLGGGVAGQVARWFAFTVAAATVSVLTYGSIGLVAVNRQSGKLLPIGKATRSRRVRIEVDGKKRAIEARGYEHFKDS